MIGENLAMLKFGSRGVEEKLLFIAKETKTHELKVKGFNISLSSTVTVGQ